MYVPGPRLPGWLTPVLVISLIILLVTFMRPEPRPRIAHPSVVTNTAIFSGFSGFERIPPTAGPNATPQAITGDFSQINQLDLVIADGLFDSQAQSIVASELDTALAYVSARFGTTPQERIKTVLANETSCGLHGIAYTDIREVQVFTCAQLPRQRAINILAHEFIHQLSHDRYGPRHLSADLILLEGVATWGAGRYWLGDYDSFRSMVRPYKQNGSLLPLAMSYVGQSINVMNQLYYQWASFVEFLIETYGRERFDALYVTGSSSPGSADYRGVYGKDLATLEAEWQAWLDRP